MQTNYIKLMFARVRVCIEWAYTVQGLYMAVLMGLLQLIEA